jgi:murein DD-endopeptidase MepM/ murein hydrolase activator NlpD
MLIPDNATDVRQFRIAVAAFRFLSLIGFMSIAVLGYFSIDYLELRSFRSEYRKIRGENLHLKGEAQILMENLEDVKGSLRRIQDYSGKLTELVSLKVKKVAKDTGIGPLSNEEYSSVKNAVVAPTAVELSDGVKNVPLGIDMDGLIFQPVLMRLSSLGSQANRQAIELKNLLASLSQKETLLSSVPSARPVDGWITSEYGKRFSPFTGERTFHRGLDIASSIGTPIYAPADGVVVFSGAKAGFGNFIMIAHGYGVVTRYGHNTQNIVQAGQRVSKGEQIATVGSSGRATGPHLHYEVWVNGAPTDPAKFILDAF